MSPQETDFDRIVRLKITLDGIKPAIWRQIEVPDNAPLTLLHEVIQAAMPFENYHLFAFEAGPPSRRTRYAIPDPEGDFTPTMDARRVCLGDLINAGTKRFSYTYDFGDDWRHTIAVEAIVLADPALSYPRFVAGANRAPPEDVGGAPGFEHFLEVMADPDHEEHAELLRWYGKPFNPKDISKTEIEKQFRKLAKPKVPAKRTSKNKLH